MKCSVVLYIEKQTNKQTLVNTNYDDYNVTFCPELKVSC